MQRGYAMRGAKKLRSLCRLFRAPRHRRFGGFESHF
jgi:hypothetical protein